MLTIVKHLLPTKLGEMIAIADEKYLYFLEFTSKPKLERTIERFIRNNNVKVIDGITYPIESITRELQLYFSGVLKEFSTPFQLLGTQFQILAWHALLKIPYGQTKSYSVQAQYIGASMAHRAVANANGANKLAIIVPCHRIINSDGSIGGYSGGVERKQWLVQHEQENIGN